MAAQYLRRLFAVLGACLLTTGTLDSSVQAQDPALTIGSPAPALNIEHWVQTGEGRFKPVTRFQRGRVYVVEFWATWCGPCVASMPHIAEMQERYADQGVQVISISDEDLDTVEAFLKKPVRQNPKARAASNSNETAMTYGELTKTYCLTTDPDGSVNEDYMKAAERDGIPCAFIVGKQGQIEWIGHPMQMETPLQAVIENRWDREGFRVAYLEERQYSKVFTNVVRLLKAEKVEPALELVGKAIKGASTDNLRGRYQLLEFQVLLTTNAAQDQLVASASRYFQMTRGNATATNELAWGIYEKFAAEKPADFQLIDLAIQATAEAVGRAEGVSMAYVLDTLAHLHYLRGDLDQAIATQQKATQVNGSQENPGIAEFLQQLKAEKANQ